MTRRAIAAGLVVAGLLAGCSAPKPIISPIATPTPIATPDGTVGPGADGIGDPYYPSAGNGGYDVASYDLDLRYVPATDVLSGTATITAKATAGLATFNLDLAGLTVEQVTVDGADATTDRDGGELVVTPAAPILAGDQFVVAVTYSGVPAATREEGLGETGFLHTDNGAVAIGEPFVAASWFPVNDHPRDKATYTIGIAAPENLSALSNGVLRGKSTADGFTTWEWEVTRPMAPYLATVVIGSYRLQESTHDGMPVVLAVDTDLPTSIDTLLARSGEVVDFLEQRFGPYPFDALGGIVIDDKRVRFALENQTRPIYSDAFFEQGDEGVWVIVHELAHQWYGDSVSVNEWKEIWLNEGFASYAEWLWTEAEGEQTAQGIFNRFYETGNTELWLVPPGDPGSKDLFSGSVYIRGAMTLHALRVTVGDDDFFAILKAWASEKAYTNATTKEFIALAERISGEQLDDLFDAWLYGTKRPDRP
jgi:aminopeptidase N